MSHANQIILDGEHLTLEDVMAVAYGPSRGIIVEVALSEEARRKVRRAEQAVQTVLLYPRRLKVSATKKVVIFGQTFNI